MNCGTLISSGTENGGRALSLLKLDLSCFPFERGPKKAAPNNQGRHDCAKGMGQLFFLPRIPEKRGIPSSSRSTRVVSL